MIGSIFRDVKFGPGQGKTGTVAAVDVIHHAGPAASPTVSIGDLCASQIGEVSDKRRCCMPVIRPVPVLSHFGPAARLARPCHSYREAMFSISLVLGIVGQLFIGTLLAFFAIFAGAGLHNGRELTRVQSLILDNAMWVLPGTSLAVLVFFVYHAATGGPQPSLWWHLLPVLAGGAYLAYAARL